MDRDKEIENERLKTRTRIRHAAIEIALMTKSEQSFFLEWFFKVLPEDQRADFIAQVARYLYDDPKWGEIEKWMDNTFEKHPDYFPVRVANMCIVNFNIKRSMRPLLIIKAQKAKNRFFKRRAYYIQKGVY